MPPESGVVDWGGRFLPTYDLLYTGILAVAFAVVLMTGYFFLAWLPEHVHWFSDRTGRITGSVVCALEAVAFVWILIWPPLAMALGMVIAIYMLVWLYGQVRPGGGHAGDSLQ